VTNRAVRFAVGGIAAAAVLGSCVLSLAVVDHVLLPKSYGPYESGAVRSTADELSEADALAAARAAIDLAGESADDFVPFTDDRATGVDLYLVRNATSNLAGTLDWRSIDGSRRFIARVWMSDGKIYCELVVPR
jgi:hypothetical protein